ncbi:energy transducer TonB [Granulicella tundricola]|uniref:TonB family protein n=1 Tax=Granulicella tundricola (strain ATCC BAA-1859 / DSM 23138 / MP5ACTX9) TaxID=1198114 RepID=E8X467_GRATM|nr:energy transducer TonB [Granulicella tundricola]ADW67127.1 TonB family protein [Granulicella tundricola MP5ACTX9]
MSSLKMASVVLHVVVVAALLYKVQGVAKAHRAKSVARVLVPYAPGHTAAAQPPKPKIIRPKVEPKIALKEPEPPPPASGGDPTGEADVSVAMANFYPAPKPDLSELPHGTHGDIVVDVTIDEDGKVVYTHVDEGLGHGVDEAVLAVLQTWTFYPATKAGKPVASVQQLLFHFDRA